MKRHNCDLRHGSRHALFELYVKLINLMIVCIGHEIDIQFDVLVVLGAPKILRGEASNAAVHCLEVIVQVLRIALSRCRQENVALSRSGSDPLKVILWISAQE